MDFSQYSHNDFHNIIKRLKALYPERAEEASQILLNEYNLPMEVASSIMHIVRLAVEGRQWQSWPFLDVSRQPFFIN